MSTVATPAPSDLVPVVDDLSAFIIAGRVRASVPVDMQWESVARTPRQGLDDAVEAERLGFRRIFLAERYNLKEAGALLGGIGARTSRLGLATGIILPTTRHPLLTAGLGSTMQATYGPRFTLGLGRGGPVWVPGVGHLRYQALIDYADIVKRLWQGETVTYDGPAGSYENLALGDAHDGPAPEIWMAVLGGPLATKAAASPVFDGVLLSPMLTPEGCHKAIGRIRAECERTGRDPATLRMCQPVVTAPDLDDFETRALAHARAVTYLQIPGFEKAFSDVNGWDTPTILRLQGHDQFAAMATPLADQNFHRAELLEPAKLVPDEWMDEACALGSVDDCVHKLAEFRSAGADELATYGSTPGQNAGLIREWRQRTETGAG